MLDLLSSIPYSPQGKRWLYGLIGLGSAAFGGILIAKLGMTGVVFSALIPIGLIVVGAIFRNPKLGLLTYIQLSYLVNALARFLPFSLPYGLIIDGVLGLTLLSLVVNAKSLKWERIQHPTFYLVLMWFVYNVLEIANPESPYRAAWFYHARQFSIHWIMVCCIILVLDITRKDIVNLLKTWMIWSIFAALWAFKQQYISLTNAEIEWLNAGGAKTHILFGHLRSFSFYTDASQFGAEMAGLTLVCLIFMFEEKTWKAKIPYLILAFFYFWGFAVSGTRSALFIMLAGYPFYLFIKRDFNKILLGMCVAIPMMIILLFTNIGNTNYQIYRIRTALRPMEDPSFLLRLENQQKLSNYLRHLPFGAGIGSAGDTGARFSPHHFASQTPPDSWFVQVWIETGVVGLYVYIGMLLGIIAVGVHRIWNLQDPWLIKIMCALLAEFVGVVVMGYSNPVMGQFPTSSFIFITSILFTSSERWDPAFGLMSKKGKR
ncbi:O-antigen ligase family protein [Runella sp. MFBS21]|uniref:O-antigen ligase family protein n=1 Tax=Runella sp. MFBS21 TaxID=3034018 RepID=UPI0023F6308F|nr:O-antigen ligase family protein [Runella sp. MFBS21]MDF7821633.1 O-antigen ligase family protein [Runella sp. MFBS21]